MTEASLLCIFSAPKAFSDPEIARIQRNAIRSWQALGPQVEVKLLGDEHGLVEAAQALGVDHLGGIQRNSSGTPLVSAIFASAARDTAAPALAYVNADIILLPDLLPAVAALQDQAERFLGIGRRWDLAVEGELDFGPEGQQQLRCRLQAEGRLHPPAGSDYFIFPEGQFTDLPDFAIGRAGWDNWMIFKARRMGWPTVDLSGSVTAIHQTHDYRHLPGGQAHYRLPESEANIRLAGGRRRIFTLADASHSLRDGRLRPKPLSVASRLREIEISPLLRTDSQPLAEAVFALFHPRQALGEWLGRFKYFVGRRSERRGS